MIAKMSDRQPEAHLSPGLVHHGVSSAGGYTRPCGIAAWHPRQAEVLTQRPAFILATEQPAALQFRNHQLDKIPAGTWQVRRLHIEPVRRTRREPFLHQIGDLCISPYHTERPEAGGDHVEQLPIVSFARLSASSALSM